MRKANKAKPELFTLAGIIENKEETLSKLKLSRWLPKKNGHSQVN